MLEKLNETDQARIQAEAAQAHDPRATVEFGLVEPIIPHHTRTGSAWLMIVGVAFFLAIVVIAVLTKR